MDTRITARHIEVPDGLRAHIQNSVGKLGRYYDGIHDAHIILDEHEKTGTGKIAEITLSVSRQQLRAAQTADSHQEAVTGCVRQLRRQVMRYKDRLKSVRQDRHR